MDWLKRFMMGRYGGDQLSMFLFILSIALILLGRITSLPIFGFISYIPLCVCIFRMFSKNISRRRMENYKFSTLVSPVYLWFMKTQSKIKDTKTHKHFKCPNCNAELRVPKVKKKIIITCPKCKTEFTKRA